ncbi:MAG: site-2 protease, Metallo peptidase family [Rhodopila sp.]|nr:site-2 protease, Metallo peptidase family [Rhodopila sp.]
MPDILSALRAAAAMLLVGNLLIVAHEMGHFLAARCAGVRVLRFTIGFGPVLARRIDARGTTWTLSLLPLGGYVGFEGEQDAARPGSYAGTSPLARMAIIAAGPAANVGVAIAVFALLLALFGAPGFLPIASTVVAGSAADRAGFHVGDRVLTMDGQRIKTFEDMRPGLKANPGKTIRFTIERDGKPLDLVARLGTLQADGKTIGLLGITSLVPFHQPLSPTQIASRAFGETWQAIADSVQGITKVVLHGEGGDNVAGVVGIAQLTGHVAQQGTGPFLALIAILSANLALMNLLPIPVLDGGALLFCAAELVLRRPLPARAQAFGTRAGVAVLASLFMVATLHDIAQTGLFRWIAGL